ncbi:MAG: mercury transporter MerT [Hyphomicrobiales bacterium]|nr:mercury transporter MerT [Hyphomicrobiales bacterium]
MSDVSTGAEVPGLADSPADGRKEWFAAGGIVAAILASACCIGPLILVLLGVSGAWIGNLTALEPYKPYFATVAAVFIGLGFWQIYFRVKPVCVDGSYCARPDSSRITKTVLWLSAVLVALAMTVNWWAPVFY